MKYKIEKYSLNEYGIKRYHWRLMITHDHYQDLNMVRWFKTKEDAEIWLLEVMLT